MQRIYLWFVTCLIVTSCLISEGCANTVITNNGKSTFTIVVPSLAPDSVTLAAQELQRDIAEATRVKLPIKKDSENFSGPIISLGSTNQAKVASITSDGIADGGFRIVTRSGNLYIIGLDTAAKQGTGRGDQDKLTPNPNLPGPQFTQDGGFSNGTANGVYTFLEDYLNVRWLMPGELGRDIPSKSTFTVSDIDRTEAPGFIFRSMTFLASGAERVTSIYHWKLHQRLGSSFRLNYMHNWMKTVPADLYKTHPDWFAMKNGKRIPPVGHYKLETTNPELVRYYADKAIAAFKADPSINTFSLSPSDGYGWSESPESEALTDPAKPGPYSYPPNTRAILKFYRDVAAIVEKEYPRGKLAGFIYDTYLLPPSDGNMVLPQNFIPVLAPDINYFYGLYRKGVRKKFENVISSWGKVAPPNWFIYDIPTSLSWVSESGIITPSATRILDFYYPLLVENHIKGLTVPGHLVWSQGALNNYIHAKLMWNPKLDAHALQTEWLARAYGEDAGAVMDQFYQKLDDWFMESWRGIKLGEANMKDIYGAHYPEMEKLFMQAKAQPMTEIQKRRFHLLEINMIALQWRLRNAGYLPRGFTSQLQCSGTQIENLLFDGSEVRRTQDNAFPLLPVPWYSDQPKRTKIKVQLNRTPPQTDAPSSAVNVGYIQLYATQTGDVNVKLNQVDAGSAYVAYSLYPSDNNNDIQRGLAYTGATFHFKAHANTYYLLRLSAYGIYQPKLNYDLSIAGATLATGSYQDGTLYLQGKVNAPLYVYASGGLSFRDDAVQVSINTESPAAAARAAVLQRHPGSKVLLALDNEWSFQTDPKKVGLQRGVTKPDYDDKLWKLVDANETWNLQGFPDYQGVAWYRKTVTLPPIRSGSRLSLFFGGVEGDAVVYLNGQKVGEHSLDVIGGSWEGSFELDVTNTMKPGKNILAVQVTKDDPVGGIDKGVALLKVPEIN